MNRDHLVERLSRFESPASGEKSTKKVPKKVILLKSTEESTQKCTQTSAQVKKD